jgi:hypothetical protein|tara:strand:+ start:88 stop:1131 length:1044 start_codon:yes stop_codon:yes gene_type:complete
MKKISKLLVGILFSALVIAPSYAGEMSVTGGATATYSIGGDSSGSGKTLGISNELDFTASGELDNGYTWKYQVQLDNASTANDDTRLEIGTDMGNIGLYISEGGMSKELHGVGAMGPGFDYHSPATFQTGYDVDGYGNIQYHSPAGVLPFGAQIKLGYVPDMNDTAMMSAKDANSNPASHATGRNLTQVNVTASPLDGLSLQADAAQTSNETGVAISTEEGVSANVGAKYTMGPVTIGYVEGGYQPAVASGEITYYENNMMGIQFDVNDSLSVSYNVDESNKNARATVAAGATAGTKTEVEMEQKTIQLAYTTGGATIGLAQAEVSNSDYTEGKDENQTIVSLAIAF